MKQSASTKSAVQSPIGKHFLDSKRISEEQLEKALEYKQEHGVKLGQALTALGYVSESDLLDALRQQGRINCINLRPELVNVLVAMEFGEKRSRQFRAVALSRIAGYTTVAMEDPSDVYAIDALGRHLESRVLPVYAEPSKIQSTIDHIFSHDVSRAPLNAQGALQGNDFQPAEFASRIGLPVGIETIKLEGNGPAKGCSDAPPRVKPIERGMAAQRAEPKSVDGQSALSLLRNLLQEAFLQGASDLHIESRPNDVLVRFRVDGQLFDRTSVEKRWERFLLDRLKQLARLDPDQSHVPQSGRAQFRYNGNPIDLRVTTMPCLYGESVVIRIVDSGRDLRDVDGLGMQAPQRAALNAILAERDGLMLVAGPATSGKTATLYALLRALDSRQRKLVTLEQPIENELESVTQVPINPEIGFGFEQALRSVLTQDPDVVLVGELRSVETLSIALHAALSGRTILSSWHAVGAPDAVRRLVDWGAEPFQLADALRGVVGQRLLRQVCQSCKEPASPPPELLAKLGLTDKHVTYFFGRGCAYCRGSGFQGRIAAFEVLTASAELRQAISRRAELRELREVAIAGGMIPMRQDALARAKEGLTTLDEVLAKTN